MCNPRYDGYVSKEWDAMTIEERETQILREHKDDQQKIIDEYTPPVAVNSLSQDFYSNNAREL